MRKFLLPLLIAAYAHSVAHAQTPSPDDASSTSPKASGHIVETAGPLTLAAALEFALQANADIAAAAWEVEAQRGAIRQSATTPNPHFAANIEDTQAATRTTTVQLSQMIELGGKRSARMTVAELNFDAAMAELALKRADIRATVITVFYELLAAQERHGLALQSVEIAQQASNAAARRVIAGKISPVEETKARIAESSMRIELARAVSVRVSARKRLAATWRGTTANFERVEGDLAVLPELPVLDSLVQRLSQSPALRRAQIEVERRQALSQVERARQTLDVVVSVGARRDEQLGRNQALVGVSIPIPLFDRNQGNLQETLRRVDKAQDELTANEAGLDNSLTRAHEQLFAARLEAQLLKRDILPGAQSAYDAATKGFEFGKFNFLDVLDAQRTLLQAKSQYLRVLSEAHGAAAEIERILGASSTLPHIPLDTNPGSAS
jgi:cobalt-zinc-cadmium efflux system outer membrane protein